VILRREGQIFLFSLKSSRPSPKIMNRLEDRSVCPAWAIRILLIGFYRCPLDNYFPVEVDSPDSRADEEWIGFRSHLKRPVFAPFSLFLTILSRWRSLSPVCGIRFPSFLTPGRIMMLSEPHPVLTLSAPFKCASTFRNLSYKCFFPLFLSEFIIHFLRRLETPTSGICSCSLAGRLWDLPVSVSSPLGEAE